MKNYRVLVGTLFSNVKDYCIRDWFKNVCQFTYRNFDLYAVDNSADKKYHKKIFNYFISRKKPDFKISVVRTPRISKESEIFMAFSAKALRDYFLRNQYDYLFYLECDIFPPLDIIERLLAYKLPIISGMYFIGKKADSYPMINRVNEYDYGSIFHSANDNFLNVFYQIKDVWEYKPVFNCGIGCSLIHRSIIERIPFREGSGITQSLHHDSAFAEDLYRNNIQNLFVPIVCRHENQDWKVQKQMIKKMN